MKRIFCICLALLVTPAYTVLAGAQTYTTTDKGVSIVTIDPSRVAPPTAAAADPDRASYTTLFSNLSDSMYGTYFCCSGTAISGPNGPPFDSTFWLAIPFTPTATLKRLKIEAPFFASPLGGTPSIAVWLAADAGGVPGDTIAGPVDVDSLPLAFVGCCSLSTVKFDGIQLSKNTQYWIVVGTDANSLDASDVWDFNSTDMRLHTYAVYASDGKWLSEGGVLPAIGIFGN